MSFVFIYSQIQRCFMFKSSPYKEQNCLHQQHLLITLINMSTMWSGGRDYEASIFWQLSLWRTSSLLWIVQILSLWLQIRKIGHHLPRSLKVSCYLGIYSRPLGLNIFQVRIYMHIIFRNVQEHMIFFFSCK